MNDREILERAKIYIEKMANGINPLTDLEVNEDDMINNVRISRCLFYVSDVLQKILNEEKVKINSAEKMTNKSVKISSKDILGCKLSEDPIPASTICKNINDTIKTDCCGKMTYNMIANYLLHIDVLMIVETDDGKKRKVPTIAGLNLGLSNEKRIGKDGEYNVVLYNKTAQRFILDNIEAIVALHNS